MSLPVFNPQTHLFGLQAAHEEVFEKDNRYRLLAERIYSLLVKARPQMESSYCADNGRPAIEPVLLLGVSVFWGSHLRNLQLTKGSGHRKHSRGEG